MGMWTASFQVVIQNEDAGCRSIKVTVERVTICQAEFVRAIKVISITGRLQHSQLRKY
jgi:hypothetical protein